MSSYKVKITDSANKLLVIDVELPFFGGLQHADNPDSNWTTETTGGIIPNIGRCNSQTSSGSQSAASSDGSSDGSTASSDGSSGQGDGSSGVSTASSDGSSDGSTAPVSGDAAAPVSPLSSAPPGSDDLYLCVATAPYNHGVVLNHFMGTFTANASGVGQLLSGFTVSGGLAAGAITWLQL